MQRDDRNNIIKVCLFESHLAKYFIEHYDIFKPFIHKILEAIESLVKLNHKNEQFNRMLFSVFSTLAEHNPEIKDLNSLKQSNSLIVFDTFFKYFAEGVLSLPAIKLPEMDLSHLKQVPPLNALTTYSLFKNPIQGEALLLETVRPKQLFSAKNRGVTELNAPDIHEETRNLGILSDAYTPTQLTDYFAIPHSTSRQFYYPKENSLMALWLRKYNLPIIAGASGGIGKTVSKLASLLPISKNEYQLLGLLVAASTIALGHHSFFEVIRPLSFLTGNLEDKDNLLEFYEQVIPDEIKCLPSYKEHINSEFGSSLIEEFVFQHPHLLKPK